MINFILSNLDRRYAVCIFPFLGAYIGKWLDDMETERMTRFRDKSSLYYRELAPGEKPSWP